MAEHKESTARQYALADVAVALGWPRDRVEIIDADQGRTAQTVEGRRGIQYILAELGLDHVGILLGQDASRLARSDPDWVPMVRSCGLFRALLGDYDGLYDPTDFNDRLLLGFKGIMSEAELHFLRARMHEGRLNKARRGELFNHASIGYVREPAGGLALDPDEQVQQVVRLVFDQFDRQGTLHGLLRTWSITGSACRSGPTPGPIGGSWNGVAPTGRRSRICCIIRSMPATIATATVRSIPPKGAWPARDGADDQQAGGLYGAAGGPLPGLHHAGTVLGEPGAAGGQPRPLRCRGGGAPGALPPGRNPPVRPVRAADDGGL